MTNTTLVSHQSPVTGFQVAIRNLQSSILSISCPKCGAEVPLNEALSHRIREELGAEFETQRQQQNAALAEREHKLDGLKTELESRANSVNDLVASQLQLERKKLAADAARKAEEKLSVEMTDLRVQLEEQTSRLKGAQATELELRKEKRELETARENLELEVARKLDTERAQIAEAARQQALEGERLKLADRDHKITDLQQQITALQQRAEQGSMQLQGETLELTLENDLRQTFPCDQVVETKTGERGADILQRVRANGAMDCGSILWEAKRAKNWSPGWVEKLKEDQRSAKAELAVLVVTCPPPGVRGIAQLDGVWVCEPLFACALAAALRHGLISTAVRRTQETGRSDKMTQLYNYLCGLEFRQHIEAVVESFKALQEQVATEKRCFARQWKEREEQLSKALQHTAMLYGSIQGIAGRAALPEIQSLQLADAGEQTEVVAPAIV